MVLYDIFPEDCKICSEAQENKYGMYVYTIVSRGVLSYGTGINGSVDFCLKVPTDIYIRLV